MNKLRFGVLANVALLVTAFCANSAFADLVSQYTFNRDTILRAKVGQDAYEGTIPADNKPPAITNLTDKITNVTDAAVLGTRTGVISIPKKTTLAIPNPGLLKTWTMVLHFYAPKAGLSNNYDTFFQIGTIDNTSDGSLFLKGGSNSDGSIGGGTYDAVTGVFDSWHQLVVSCNNGTASVWYDTTKLPIARSYDLTNKRFIYLSLDNNGEDGTLYFDEVRLYNEALPSAIFNGGSTAQVIATDADAATPYADAFISASVTPQVIELDGQLAYVFPRVGSFTFTPAQAKSAQLLLVGGGGAGGLIRGGGGGAGGLIYTNAFALQAQAYQVTVGGGGVPAVSPSFASNKADTGTLGVGMTPAFASGGSTSISTNGVQILSAVGGGGGGNFVYRSTNVPAEGVGLAGGSSGGSAGKCTTVASATVGQGNAGGAALSTADNVSGGGGGAGAVGADATPATSGNGGAGLVCSITGEDVTYAGGGGASGYGASATTGGAGGGGLGPASTTGTIPVPAMNGVNGLGSGGGGGNGKDNNAFWYGGGAGGSGVFIVRLVTDPYVPGGTAGVTNIAMDHATLSATVTSFGGEATKAFATLVYGTSPDGSDAVTAFQDVEVVQAGGSASATVSALGRSVRYYAVATISNELGSVIHRRFEFVSSDQVILETSSYMKKAEITVSGYTGTETLYNFPVLLRLRTGTPVGFMPEDCAAGGADLRFADANGLLMDSEVEVWNPTGESIVWVRVPELPPSGATFTMYYAAVPSATLQTVSSTGVWKDYAGVWHMNDTGSYATTRDSTANANHGNDNSKVKPAGTGPVGGARYMGDRQGDNSAPYCGTIVPAAASLDVAPNFTFSFWSQFHTSPNNSWSHFMNRRATDGDAGGWSLQWRNGSLSFATCGAQDVDGPSAFFGVAAANAVSNWTHVVCSVAGSQISLYTNGVLVATKTSTAGVAGGNGRALGLGTKYAVTTDSWGGLNGDMDETRLRVGAVSADWAKATYASMTSGSFLSFGTVQNMDTSAPVIEAAPTVVKNAGGLSYTFSATITGSVDATYSVYAIYDGVNGVSITNTLATAATVGADGTLTLSEIPANLAPDTFYSWAVRAVSNTGAAARYSVTTLFYTGVISAEATRDANEFGRTSGAITLRRASAAGATNAAFTVSYSVSGTATPGSTYTALSGTATFPVGADAVTISIAPLTDLSVSENTTIVVTLSDAELFFQDATDSTATVSVLNDGNVTMSGIGLAPSAGGQSISIAATDVAAGTTYAVTLSVDGSDVRTWTNQTAAATFDAEISGGAGTTHSVVFTVVSTTSLGVSFTKTYAQTVSIGSTSQSVSSFEQANTAAAAILLHVGDSVNLPQGNPNCTYRILQPRVLEGNGADGFFNLFAARAIEPGICGIEYVRGDLSATNTVAVIVLPEKIANGTIYVYDEKSSSKDYWTRSASWRKLNAAGTDYEETNDSWPCQADDIAILPFYELVGGRYIRLEADVTVGAVYCGQFRNKALSDICIDRQSTSPFRTFTFKRTDGKPALLQLSPNGQSWNENLKFRLGGYPIAVFYESDTVMDGGWSGLGPLVNPGRWEFSSCTNNIAEGVTLEFRNVFSQGQSMGATFASGSYAGKGTVWNRSAAVIRYDGNFSAFSGAVRDSGQGAGTFDRTAPTFWRSSTGTNVLVETEGFVPISGGRPQLSSAGAGVFRTGWDPVYGAEAPHPDVPWFPKRGIRFLGGTYYASSSENGGWGVGVKEMKLADKMIVDSGFSMLYMGARSNTQGHPINWFEANAIEQGGKGTIVLHDNSRWNFSATETNNVTILHGVSNLLIGAGGDPLTSDTYSILPWAISGVTTSDNGWQVMLFACFDANNRLVKPVYSNTTVDGGSSDTANVYSWDKNLTLTKDVATMNSLTMNNTSKTKTMGVGKKIVITSGGLSLIDNNACIGTSSGGTANGELVLGDAQRPAYVFAGAKSESTPDQIWATITAPGGFVVGYTGYFLLGGDQKGIDGEFVVNSGTTTFGALDGSAGAQIDVPLRIVGGATTVKDMKPGLFADKAGARTCKLTFERVAGYTGKFVPPAGQTEIVNKLYIHDIDTDETISLPRGTWGSSASAAEFKDDDLFVGTGILQVRSDDLIDPFVIRIR